MLYRRNVFGQSIIRLMPSPGACSVSKASNSFLIGVSARNGPPYEYRIFYTQSELLFYSENCVLCHFGDSESEHGFGWNPDLLLRLGIKARARLPLLFH